MTLAPANPLDQSVEVTRTAITVRELTIHNAEAAQVVAAHAESFGSGAAADMIRRAVPIGIVALSLSSASVDSSALQRTLDAFAENVDARSGTALAGLDSVLARLRDGERAVEDAAQAALAQLPAQLERALSGEAATVKQAVTAAAQQVHAASLDEMRRALSAHSESVRQALSLDGNGPVQSLRRDLMSHIDSTRRELAEQLTVVRELLRAADAAKAASTTSTRAVGAAFEAHAVELVERIVTAAGDRWEATGSYPAPGTTSRAGDGLATLTSAISGSAPCRLVVEAKTRTRPLTARAWRDALAEARSVRDAAGAIALVPSADQVPGHAAFARVDQLSFVVSADPEHVQLVYLVLRELVALVSIRQHDGDEIDLAKLEAQMNAALAALKEFGEIAKLTDAAAKNLASIREVGRRVHTSIHQALTAGMAALHQ